MKLTEIAGFLFSEEMFPLRTFGMILVFRGNEKSYHHGGEHWRTLTLLTCGKMNQPMENVCGETENTTNRDSWESNTANHTGLGRSKNEHHSPEP